MASFRAIVSGLHLLDDGRGDGADQVLVLLGTGDLRLIRMMISLLMDQCLVECSRLIPQIATIDPTQLMDLGKSVSVLLKLCESPHPPSSQRKPNTDSGDSDTGTNHNQARQLPPTAITQHIHLHYIPKVILATILVAYPPTIPPPVFAGLRIRFRNLFNTEGTTNAILGHSVAAIRLATAKDPKDESGWNRVWPRYAVEALGRQLDGLVSRPGGVKALIYNVMGADAVMAHKMRKSAWFCSHLQRTHKRNIGIMTRG